MNIQQRIFIVLMFFNGLSIFGIEPSLALEKIANTPCQRTPNSWIKITSWESMMQFAGCAVAFKRTFYSRDLSETEFSLQRDPKVRYGLISNTPYCWHGVGGGNGYELIRFLKQYTKESLYGLTDSVIKSEGLYVRFLTFHERALLEQAFKSDRAFLN